MRTSLRSSYSIAGLLVLCLLSTAAAARADGGLCPELLLTSLPLVVRAEGLADLQGDIVGTCAGDPSFGGIITVNVNLFLNVNVTNRVNYGMGLAVTDAVLVINEQTAFPPTPAFVPGSPTLGTLVAANQLVWTGVQIPLPPGPSDTLTLRFTNLRANGALIGFPPPSSPPAIMAFVSFTGSVVLVPSPPIVNIGFTILGLPGSLLPGGSTESFFVRLSEGFADAFKVLGVPAVMPGLSYVEDGYPTPGSGVNGGGASQATRMRIRFLNVPPNTRLAVPTNPAAGTLALSRVILTTPQGAGGFPLLGFPFPLLVPVFGGSGSLFYQVEKDNQFAIEWIDIPVVACAGLFGPPSCAAPLDVTKLKGLQVEITFAPVSGVGIASSTAPLPRFVNSGTPLPLP
jgi:hypothetical protein